MRFFVLANAGNWLLDWLTFVAALLAAIAAAVAVGFTAVTHRRAVDNERKAQAAKLGMWIENGIYHRGGNPPRWDPFDVVVYNGSDQPIHDVIVERLPIEWTRKSSSLETVNVTVVLPQKEAPWMPFSGFEGKMPVEHGLLPASPPLRVSFTDNGGVRWVRHPNGELVEGDADLGSPEGLFN